MKKKKLVKLFLVFGAIVIYLAGMFVLNLSAKNGRKTEELLPDIPEAPIYVECEQGHSLELLLEPTEDFSISGLQILLVNLSDESEGSFQVSIRDDLGNLLSTQATPIESITPGQWFLSVAELDFCKGEKYHISFLADRSAPYFMRITKENDNFPYKATVIQENGQKVDSQISVGVNVVTSVDVKFSDIFYYSEFFITLALILAILFILVGKKRIFETIGKIPVKEFVFRYGNDLFLLLLFFSLCVNIISKAYSKGVYITADSTGYLREAINLTKGYGFSYDGLAGYESWFANWPILYPLMIAGVMLITGTNAYLASKILSMILVGCIILVLRLFFKKNAWFYALALTNIGFMSLTCYTWSEIPFILFLLCFAIALSRIICVEEPLNKMYFFLSISGICCFLTRYFGIYIWIVVGFYLICLFLDYYKYKEKPILNKIVKLTVTSAISGFICMAYLLLNKIKNGKPSGVSRGIWWDDYEILTNDLIETLLKEVCNAFSIQVPQIIDEIPFNMKVWVLLIIFIGLALFIYRKGKRFTWQSIMITLGVFYYLIFIAIRYRSSMDSFYFRFFEPASFLICLGIMGILLPVIQNKRGFHYFACAVTGIIIITLVTVFQVQGVNSVPSYYSNVTDEWDNAYKEIPQKSVIIFNDIDFRSSFYRPDVMDGTIVPQDTFENVKTNYYGSDYLCIRANFAKTMLESGEYESSVTEQLQQGLDKMQQGKEFIVIRLK